MTSAHLTRAQRTRLRRLQAAPQAGARLSPKDHLLQRRAFAMTYHDQGITRITPAGRALLDALKEEGEDQ